MDVYRRSADERIRLTWMGGAGFLITFGGLRIGIDIYLSDACHGADGSFKRLTPAPCRAQELDLDYLISTHDHGDHFDVISVPEMLNMNGRMKVICPSSVITFAGNMGLDTSRFIRIDRGTRFQEETFSLQAVTADHGEETPDAIGVIITMGGKRIFFAGDGTWHDHYRELTMGETGFDVLLVAINGRYGNPDSSQAADIASMLEAKLVIPCHYWMFREHGGDPQTFVTACLEKEPPLKPVVLAVGEAYTLQDD